MISFKGKIELKLIEYNLTRFETKISRMFETWQIR